MKCFPTSWAMQRTMQIPEEGRILEVRDLCKRYADFALDHVSFSLSAGTITGFVGRNGAGKSTTLKALLNLVHPDSGEIRFFGRDFLRDEQAIKRQIGYVSGGVSYYPHKKLRVIAGVSRRFYESWDEEAYRGCLSRFALPEDRTPLELSEGMKVKFALTLALSHHAKLLILDEPTSGLDPVSREDLLEIFLQLVREERVTILFSTHITSDLEQCADDILYIRNGEIAENGAMQDFADRYRLVKTAMDPGRAVIGARESKGGWTGLIRCGERAPDGAEITRANLEEILVHLEKEM